MTTLSAISSSSILPTRALHTTSLSHHQSLSNSFNSHGNLHKPISSFRIKAAKLPPGVRRKIDLIYGGNVGLMGLFSKTVRMGVVLFLEERVRQMTVYKLEKNLGNATCVLLPAPPVCILVKLCHSLNQKLRMSSLVKSAMERRLTTVFPVMWRCYHYSRAEHVSSSIQIVNK